MRDYLDELLGAMRQYRHNDDTSKGNPPKKGFVVAYNKKETDAIFRALQHERDEAVEALREARNKIKEWAAYADDYFQWKHGLADDLAELDAILAKHGDKS